MPEGYALGVGEFGEPVLLDEIDDEFYADSDTTRRLCESIVVGALVKTGYRVLIENVDGQQHWSIWNDGPLKYHRLDVAALDVWKE
jgi:hypothetical protein